MTGAIFNLDSLLRTHPSWQTETAAKLLVWLAEESTVLKSFPLTVAKANELFDLSTASSLLDALEKEPGLKAALYQFQSGGIDLGSEKVQGELDKLASHPALGPYVPTLKGLGRKTATRWGHFAGAADMPTEAEVADRLRIMKIEETKRLSRAWHEGTLAPLVVGAINEGKTLDEIKTAVRGIV